MGEIIYEKHFHKETIEEIERERIDFVEAFGEDAEQAPSFDEIMKKIYSNVTYSSPSTFTQRLYSKGIGLSNPNGLT